MNKEIICIDMNAAAEAAVNIDLPSLKHGSLGRIVPNNSETSKELWKKAFRWYNLFFSPQLSMACLPCYKTVFDTLKIYKQQHMTKLITAAEAATLVSKSEARMKKIIEQMNSIIQSQSKQGYNWAHAPVELSEEEKKWLYEELSLVGYTIKAHHPIINW